jgi:uncharacterized protein involved in high-affinity Fe2+ transport
MSLPSSQLSLFRAGLAGAIAVLAFATAAPAIALETPIGKPQIRNAMEIAAVYLQPVAMEPEGMMRKAADSDIHLEADIHAQEKNPNGFADGAWIPYLGVTYEITKEGSAERITGTLMPMVASDGPHYGDNVKLAGPGKYKLKLRLEPPGSQHGAHFGRHTDKETGVGPWFKPFDVEYAFAYAGVGKKGGY